MGQTCAWAAGLSLLFLSFTASEPDDPYYADGKLWGLKKINAEEAWKTSTGEGVLVAVIDTGCDMDHPDIRDNLVRGYDFVNKDTNPEDDDPRNSHGSHCSGIIAAKGNNKMGIIGLAHDAKILVIKGADGRGDTTENGMAASIRYAADHKARVISISEASAPSNGPYRDAVEYAYDKGCLIVASIGNTGGPHKWYPAMDVRVMAVGHTDRNDERRKTCAYGDHLDVMAPGVDIYSLAGGGKYAAKTGSSQAAPFVSALAALIFSVNPDLTHDEVRKIICSTAVDLGEQGKDVYTGYGRIDAAAAVAEAKKTVRETAGAERTSRTRSPWGRYSRRRDPDERTMKKAEEMEKKGRPFDAIRNYEKVWEMGKESDLSEDAADRIRTLLEEHPECAEQYREKTLKPWLARAEAGLKAGDAEKAVAYAEKILRVLPESEEGPRAKEILEKSR